MPLSLTCADNPLIAKGAGKEMGMANVQLSGVAPAGGAGASVGAVASVPAVAPATAAAPLPAVDGSSAPAAALAGPDGPQQPGTAGAIGGSAASHQDSEQELKKAVKDANAALAANGTQLVFVFDDQTHHFAVKLLDIQTQKVVQELPAAAMRAAASALTGSPASGTLVDTKA